MNATQPDKSDAQAQQLVKGEGFRPVVLCVDDERAVLLTLERQLARLLDDRFDFEFAETAEEALELIAGLDPTHYNLALVITDLHMPGMRGDLLLARFAMQYPAVPQILLTGQADLSEGCPPGVHHCLAKPWDQEELEQLLRNTLGAQALAQL